MNKTWFSAKASGGVGEISIYDEIGLWGVSAKDFADSLRGLGEVAALTVNINSPGGSVFDGLAIHNMLKRHPAPVTVHVDGVAASIASVIAMAGDKVVMPENAFLMIHNPWNIVAGDGDDLRDAAEVLDKLTSSMIGIYAAKSGKDHDEIRTMMAEETWLTAAEAVEMGFADEAIGAQKIAARVEARRFKRVPEALAGRAQSTPSQEDEPMAKKTSPATAEDEDVKPKEAEEDSPANEDEEDKPQAEDEDEEKVPDAKALAYARAVADLCALAGKPGKTADYLASGKPLKAIRADLLKAKANGEEIDNKHTGQVKQAQAVSINPMDIYARRRAGK